MYIALVRHGEAVKNQDERHGLLSEAYEALTPLGIGQAQELAACVQAFQPPDTGRAVWTSPQRQCQQTAEIIADGASCTTAAGLASIDFGVLTGLSADELAQRDPAYRRGIQAWHGGKESGPPDPPGGETLSNFVMRVGAALSLAVSRALEQRSGLTVVALATSSLHAAKHWLMQHPLAYYPYFPTLLGSIEVLELPRDQRPAISLTGGFVAPASVRSLHRGRP